MHQERNRAGTRRSVGARHAKRRCPLQPGGHWPGAGSAGHGATGRRTSGTEAVSLPLTLRHGMEAGRAETARLAPFTTARLDARREKRNVRNGNFSFLYSTMLCQAEFRKATTGPLLTFFCLLIFRSICARQLLTVQSCEYAIFPGNTHWRCPGCSRSASPGINRLVHTLLPCGRQRPLYRRRLCPVLLLRRGRYSTLTSALPVKKQLRESIPSSILSTSNGERVRRRRRGERLSGRHSLPGFCARADRRPPPAPAIVLTVLFHPVR